MLLARYEGSKTEIHVEQFAACCMKVEFPCPDKILFDGTQIVESDVKFPEAKITLCTRPNDAVTTLVKFVPSMPLAFPGPPTTVKSV